MKILKTDSEIEKKVQQVEILMDELGLKIHYHYNGLQIESNGVFYPIKELDSNETCVSFPRMFESERLVVKE